PSPPPPRISLSDSETRPSIFYTGCTNTTCVVFDMGNTNFTTIELQTFEVPLGAPNLAWSFEAGATMRSQWPVAHLLPLSTAP
ncbi:hypothetical protein CYMTET_36032, partial [Cymbomonas tetramitiformis]